MPLAVISFLVPDSLHLSIFMCITLLLNVLYGLVGAFFVMNSCINNKANMIVYAKLMHNNPHDLTLPLVHTYTLTAHIITKISIAIENKGMGVVSS